MPLRGSFRATEEWLSIQDWSTEGADDNIDPFVVVALEVFAGEESDRSLQTDLFYSFEQVFFLFEEVSRILT